MAIGRGWATCKICLSGCPASRPNRYWCSRCHFSFNWRQSVEGKDDVPSTVDEHPQSGYFNQSIMTNGRRFGDKPGISNRKTNRGGNR